MVVSLYLIPFRDAGTGGKDTVAGFDSDGKVSGRGCCTIVAYVAAVTTPLFFCRFGPPRIMSVYAIVVGAAVAAPVLLMPGAGFPPASFTARVHLSC